MVKPIGKRILVAKNKKQTETEGGIYISYNEENSDSLTTGYVLAIGDRVEQISVHDRIVYEEFSGVEVNLKGKQYLILNEADVIAVMTDD